MGLRVNISLCWVLAALPSLIGVAQAETATPSVVVENAASQQKTVTILEGKATMVLPENFARMPDEQMATRYATANPRPKEVWYVDTGKSVVTLSFSQPFPGKNLADEHVPMLAEMMKKQMADLKPVLTTKKVNGRTVSRLESVGKDTSGNGTSVYSIIQLSSLDNQLMMSSFNVTSHLKDKYYPIAEAALDSLKY